MVNKESEETRPLSTKRKVAFYFIAFCFSAIVAFLFSELLLRIVYKNLPSDFIGSELFCRNKEFDYRRMKANITGYMWSDDYDKIEIVSNSKGYRDTEWESKSQEKKIMFLGDSFGWGWGCPADSMISNRLEKNGSDGTSLFNLCIPGDDLHRMYCRFQFHQQEIKPSRVVILNYINDFFNAKMQDSLIALKIESGMFKKPVGNLACSKNYDSGFKGLLNKSYAFRFLQRFRFVSNSWSSTTKHEDLLRTGFKEDMEFFKTEENAEFAFGLYLIVLRQISTNYPVSVVYIPPQYHIDTHKANEISEAFGGAVINPDFMAFYLKRIANELPNVDVIDLTGFLRIENKRQAVYITNDSHLNPHGQRLVGEYLSKLITLK